MRNLLIASTLAAALTGSVAPQAFAGTFEAWGHTFTTGDQALGFAAGPAATIQNPASGFQALAPRHHQRRVAVPSRDLDR